MEMSILLQDNSVVLLLAMYFNLRIGGKHIQHITVQGLVPAADVFYSGGTAGGTIKVNANSYVYNFRPCPHSLSSGRISTTVDMTLMLTAYPLEVSVAYRKRFEVFSTLGNLRKSLRPCNSFDILQCL